MSIKQHIPNTLTALNLLCGILATVSAFFGELTIAMLLIALGAVFDVFDGMVARMLGVSSPIGADLDSFADLITFGLAPSAVLFHQLIPLLSQISHNDIEAASGVSSLLHAAPIIPVFLLTIFAAFRLAKFNNDDRQQTGFIGLPVPANALFWIGITNILAAPFFLKLNPLLTLGLIYILVAIFCYLMISELPMLSFKVKSVRWQGNEARYILLILSCISLLLFQITGFALAVLFYVVISFIVQKRHV